MKQYLDLMRHVRDHGTRKEDRTGTLSVFGYQRKGGRPKKLTEEKIKMAKKLLKDPDQTVKGVAEMLGVGRNTLYRNLNAG
mgnify:CR=1 FL=1